MQKALTEMNVQLHHVVADITGTTGLHRHERPAHHSRDPCRRSRPWGAGVLAPLRLSGYAKALTGNFRPKHLFALEQALALYDDYHQKAAACDRADRSRVEVRRP
jgi:transposase